MTMQPDQRLLHYRLVERIGEGGMGVVWKAVDTTLDREVAIKVLPDIFAVDAERLARFEREAKLLASLNHPNIATVHGLHETKGIRFLAMELVEGESLSTRLAAGPVATDEALEIGRQVAEALEAAHDHGIIHRDLKPANIQVSSEGHVKVLDFGLAKPLPSEPVDGDPGLSPTLTTLGTAAGTILGTAAYMSPEQARGKPADRRADIWALGCVIYELLTGRRPFRGETISDTLASVLKEQPDWDALPERTPRRIRDLLRRCLTKDARQRQRDAGDVRIEIAEALDEPDETVSIAGPVATGTVSLARSPWPWLTGLLAIALLLVLWSPWRARDESVTATLQLSIPLPPDRSRIAGSQSPALTISPDGTMLVFVGGESGGRRLYSRRLGDIEALPIAGTERAEHPVFSPDGRWIAFVAEGELRRVPVHGGPAEKLADQQDARGLTWGVDGTIVYSPFTDQGLWRIPENGGPPEALTEPDSERGERSHRWPSFLPDGRHVLYSVSQASAAEGKVMLLSLDSGGSKVLIEGGSCPVYAASGHLLYFSDHNLYAVPFDLERLEIAGEAQRVRERVLGFAPSQAAHYTVSASGALIYQPGVHRFETALVKADLQGNLVQLSAHERWYTSGAPSPDGTHVAFSLVTGTNNDIWVLELERDVLTRLTTHLADDHAPVWSPDNRSVVFESERMGTSANLFLKRIDRPDEAVRLSSSPNLQEPYSFTPDGKILGFTEYTTDNGWDVRVLNLETESDPESLIRTPFDEEHPAFGPKGKWLAYESNESGESEIYVVAIERDGGTIRPAADGTRVQVSTDGGRNPRWGPDGRHLFYRTPSGLMRVALDAGPPLRPSAPEEVFGIGMLEDEERYGFGAIWPDGEHVMLYRGSDENADEFDDPIIVVNWFEQLRRLAPPASN